MRCCSCLSVENEGREGGRRSFGGGKDGRCPVLKGGIHEFDRKWVKIEKSEYVMR